MQNKYIPLFGLTAMAVAMGTRSLAQSAISASNTNPTNIMSGYVEAVRKAIVSGTEATNLTEVEVGHLMNESIKTNLAAQLWYRQAMIGTASEQGAQMAQTIRVLGTLHAGRTNDAIRLLEDALDGNIIGLATYLRASDETKTFKPTPAPLRALKWAGQYRLKFPYRSGNPATDDQVKSGLSYPDKE